MVIHNDAFNTVFLNPAFESKNGWTEKETNKAGRTRTFAEKVEGTLSISKTAIQTGGGRRHYTESISRAWVDSGTKDAADLWAERRDSMPCRRA